MADAKRRYLQPLRHVSGTQQTFPEGSCRPGLLAGIRFGRALCFQLPGIPISPDASHKTARRFGIDAQTKRMGCFFQFKPSLIYQLIYC